MKNSIGNYLLNNSSYKVVLTGEYRNGNKFGNWTTSYYKVNLYVYYE
jgi:hypothetical protein